MARPLGVKTGAQGPTHDRVAELWLAAKEVQPLEPQAPTCPHQPQKKGQGLEMLCHFSSIASEASVFVQLHLGLGLGPRCCQALMAAPERECANKATSGLCYLSLYVLGFGKENAFF